MPGIDGIECLRILEERRCSSGIIITSGLDLRILNTALRLGQDLGLKMVGVLPKPIRFEDVERLTRQRTDTKQSIQLVDIQNAIERDEFFLCCQPIMRLIDDGSERLEKLEALIRWRHPIWGVQPPNSFLPAVHEFGLMNDVTTWVLRQVVSQLQEWQDFTVRPNVSVNISPTTLTDLSLPDRIHDQIVQANLDPGRIVVEVTESAAMDNTIMGMDILTRFRLKGIGLSLDDFGTGFSSLVRLYRMPFEELKVDRSVVSDIDRTDEARIIVRSIVELGRNLGISVCAEGVETLETLEFLRNIRCDRAQGFLLSRPKEPEKLEELLRHGITNTGSAVSNFI